MSRTYRHIYTSNLYHNGEHGHHNSLTREFKEVDGSGWVVKGARNLINTRDYKSDRFKEIRQIITQKRRTRMKRNTQKMIEEQLNEI